MIIFHSSNNRQHLNVTYSGSVGLGEHANGKVLNITHGPFAITYTVHPNITNPLHVRQLWSMTLN